MTAALRLNSDNGDDGDDLLAKLRKMSIEELKDFLISRLGKFSENMVEIGYSLRVLAEKGEDMTIFDIGLPDYFMKVAYGQLLPEVLVRFAAKPALVDKIGRLPLGEQKRLASGEHVVLVVYGEGNTRTKRMADPRHMKPDQLHQVFAKDHLRNEAEQALILDDRRERSIRTTTSVGDLRIDKERGGVYVGRTFIPQSDLAAALKALQG